MFSLSKFNYILQKYNKKVRRNLHTCFLCFTFAAVREQKYLSQQNRSVLLGQIVVRD